MIYIQERRFSENTSTTDHQRDAQDDHDEHDDEIPSLKDQNGNDSTQSRISSVPPPVGTTTADTPDTANAYETALPSTSVAFGTEENTKASTHEKRPPLPSIMRQLESPSGMPVLADKKKLQWSIATLRLVIFIDYAVTQSMGPNYAILVDIGAHPDSFLTTAPFDFASATYVSSIVLIGAKRCDTFDCFESKRVAL